MGLMDKIRQAEELGREKARSAYGLARDLQEDMQRRIRQKMRVYPRPGTIAASERAGEENGASDQAALSPSEVSQAVPAGATPIADEMDDVRNLESSPEQPIVSIRGKDVGSAASGKGRRKKSGSNPDQSGSRREVA